MSKDTDKIVDEWAKRNRFDYDCYKNIIKELKDELKKWKKN